MTKTMKALCEELHLTPSYTDEKQLEELSAWCHNHVSNDLHYTGELDRQYHQYYALATQYLDNFLPYVPQNLMNTVSQFDGLTAIQYAAKCGYHYFIDSQALSHEILDKPNQNMMTPLHVSAALGYSYTVETILAKGANPRVLNNQKQYPIFFALFLPVVYEKSLVGQKQVIFRMLASKAPDTLVAQDKDGETILNCIAENGAFADLLEEIVKIHPNLVFTKNLASRYPIHAAILNGQSNVAQYLMQIESVSNLEDGKKRTPLHYAARYGNVEMVQLCINATSDIERRDSEEKTPLLLAAEAGNLEAVSCLITNGAEVTAKDLQGFSILQHAANSKNETLIQWILANIPRNLIELMEEDEHTFSKHTLMKN